MEKFIPLDAVLAEIKRLRGAQPLDAFQPKEQNKIDWLTGKLFIINSLEVFIDTLEVKEVDLDRDIRAYLTNHFNIYEDGVLQSKKSGLPLSTYDIIKVAKHFFELGMLVSNKAQKGG